MIFQKGGPNAQQNPEVTGGSGRWPPTHRRTAGDIPDQTKERKELKPGSRCLEIQSSRQLHKLGKLSKTNGETLERKVLELEEVTGHAEQQREGVRKGAGWGTLTPWLWIQAGSYSNGQQQSQRQRGTHPTRAVV